LNDVCGWKVCPHSVRRCCYAEGVKIDHWRQQDEATAEFGPGEVEFQIDGTMVNTVESGWSEVRLGVFLQRLAGLPARTWEWATRVVPPPTVRSTRVRLAPAEELAEDWRPWASTLGISDTARITVLADGAKWIWNHAAVQFPAARGVLDLFHVWQHLADATRQVYGDRPGAAQAWTDHGRRAVLADGWSGICDWIGRWRSAAEAEGVLGVTAATEELLTYLAPHVEHLGYCERLAQGRTIGSGQIEGACKYVIGRRLKRTGGRWRQANVVKMGTVCSAHYAGDWQAYWQSCLSL
jgi:hypothetical protein